MNYKCPVCPVQDDSSMDLARHMMNNFDDDHIKWMESKGINVRKSMGLRGGKLTSGDYSDLANVLEKEVKV